MKTIYRGHEIDVRREQSMGGDSNLYYSIFRVSDGYECTSGFTSDSSTPAEYTGYMKERIDAELAEADPWNERTDADDLGVMVPHECKRHADCIGRCMVCGEDVPAGVSGTFNDQGEKR